MERACYGVPGGDLVTPEEFAAKAGPRYKEQGIRPYCEACGEQVEVWGLHSPNVVSRFDHRDLAADADPLDDCVLANRGRFRGLEPDGWDDERGRIMRARFFEDENLQAAYSFCLHMCGQGNLPAAAFLSMVARADRKRVWSYVDIPLWTIPYILLTLENFTGRARQTGNPFGFHFLFGKPRGTKASALWDGGQECTIRKVFSRDGELVRGGENPFPVSDEAFKRKAGDPGWVKGALLRSLRG